MGLNEENLILKDVQVLNIFIEVFPATYNLMDGLVVVLVSLYQAQLPISNRLWQNLFFLLPYHF